MSNGSLPKQQTGLDKVDDSLFAVMKLINDIKARLDTAEAELIDHETRITTLEGP